MRVLVTGGAGFIGSHTVDALLASGHDVRVLDALTEPVHQDARRPAYLNRDAELIIGSVLDRDVLANALVGTEVVFHLGAYQDYLPDFSRFFQVNTVSTALLYELIVGSGLPVKRVILASSQAVYGEGAYICPEHGTVYPSQRPEEKLRRGKWDPVCPHCAAPIQPTWTDESQSSPHNSYAASKRAGEEIALILGRRYGIPTVVLRYSIVQGQRQSFQNTYSGALRAFTVGCLAGRGPLVYEDGKQLRDYVWVGDAVKANLLAMNDNRTDYGRFNVGGGRQVSIMKLARLVMDEIGRPVDPVVGGTYRVGDTRHVFSDISALSALGWSPTKTQVDIVREYVGWAAEQPHTHDTFLAAERHMRELNVLRSVHG